MRQIAEGVKRKLTNAEGEQRQEGGAQSLVATRRWLFRLPEDDFERERKATQARGEQQRKVEQILIQPARCEDMTQAGLPT